MLQDEQYGWKYISFSKNYGYISVEERIGWSRWQSITDYCNFFKVELVTVIPGGWFTYPEAIFKKAVNNCYIS